MAKKKPQTYTVKAGDSWAKIAGEIYGDQRMFEELMRGNKNVSMLRAGQTLVLPGKRSNPYVSDFGAAATGMATEFSPEGAALNRPDAPFAAPGQNVMNPWVMRNLQKNTGTATTAPTSGGAATTPTAPGAPATTPPKPGTMGGAAFSDAMRSTAATAGPAAALPNAASMYAQQASGQYKPQGSNIAGSATPTADVLYAQRAANRVNVPGQLPQNFVPPRRPAPAPITGSNVNLPFINPQTGQMTTSPATFQAFRTPAMTDMPRQPAATTTPAQAQPQPTINPAKQRSDAYSMTLSGAIMGVNPDGSYIMDTTKTPPAVSLDDLIGMALYNGNSRAAVEEQLYRMGYQYDEATKAYVQPGAQYTGWGVAPNTASGGGTVTGPSTTLPEYRPPVYGNPQMPQTNRRGRIIDPRRRGGGGGGTFGGGMQGANIGANWRIG